MPRFDEVLTLLEERIADLETRVRGLRQENQDLHTALARASAENSGLDEDQSGSRLLRLASIEAERAEVRGRLRSLLDGL